ncbi:MAG: SHOCT domain-containing protein, partial [Nocardioidaceae bacterium]
PRRYTMLSSAVVTTSVFANGDHWDGPGPWWPIFPILWFLFVVAVIFTFARFGRGRWGRPSNTGESRLAERFAAGEIDEREYRERLAVLKERK